MQSVFRPEIIDLQRELTGLGQLRHQGVPNRPPKTGTGLTRKGGSQIASSMIGVLMTRFWQDQRFKAAAIASSIVVLGVLSSACGSAQHPTRQICKDSCLKVDPRDQAQCLAKCD